MSEGEVEKVDVCETITDLCLQSDQALLRLVPEPSGDTSQNSDGISPLALLKFLEDEDCVVTTKPE